MLHLSIFKQFAVIAVLSVLGFGYYKWHAEPVAGDICVAGLTTPVKAGNEGHLLSCQGNVWHEARQTRH